MNGTLFCGTRCATLHHNDLTVHLYDDGSAYVQRGAYAQRGGGPVETIDMTEAREIWEIEGDGDPDLFNRAVGYLDSLR